MTKGNKENRENHLDQDWQFSCWKSFCRKFSCDHRIHRSDEPVGYRAYPEYTFELKDIRTFSTGIYLYITFT